MILDRDTGSPSSRASSTVRAEPGAGPASRRVRRDGAARDVAGSYHGRVKRFPTAPFVFHVIVGALALVAGIAHTIAILAVHFTKGLTSYSLPVQLAIGLAIWGPGALALASLGRLRRGAAGLALVSAVAVIGSGVVLDVMFPTAHDATRIQMGIAGLDLALLLVGMKLARTSD